MKAVFFLRRVLALRRQSGKVKLALFLYLLALWLGVRTGGDALAWAQAARTPTEYVLVPGFSGAVRTKQLESLFALDEVVSVTPQWKEEEETAGRSTLEAPAYRVLCQGADFSGVMRRRMEALGFSLEEDGTKEAQEKLPGEAMGLRLLSGVLAALGGRAFYKWGGMEAAG